MSRRLDYAGEAALDALLAPPFDRFARLNTFRMFAHAPAAGRAWLGVTQAIMSGLALPGDLREAAILEVAAGAGCGYMAAQHRRLAQRLGPDAVVVAAIEAGEESPAGSDLALVRAAAREVVEAVRISAETFDALLTRFGARVTIELLIVIAHYRAGAIFLTTTGVEFEEA
jgi:alkylhydroperoxidase family enzyme